MCRLVVTHTLIAAPCANNLSLIRPEACLRIVSIPLLFLLFLVADPRKPQGTILIALNPLRRVPNPDMSEYMDCSLNPEAPHPYAIAEVSCTMHLCYRIVFRYRKKQQASRQATIFEMRVCHSSERYSWVTMVNALKSQESTGTTHPQVNW